MATFPTLKPLRTGQIAVALVPIAVVEANPSRQGLVITNIGPTLVYVAQRDSVSAVTGHAIPVGTSLGSSHPGPFYAVSTGAGTIISYIEETS